MSVIECAVIVVNSVCGVAVISEVIRDTFARHFLQHGLEWIFACTEEIKADTVGKKDKFEAAFGTVAATAQAVADFHNYAAANLTDNFDATAYTANAGTYVIYGDKVVSYMTTASDVVVLDIAATSAANLAKGYYTVKNGSDVLVNVEATAANCKDLIVSDAAIDWAGMLSASALSAKAVYVGTPCGDKLAIEDVKTVEGKVTQINTVDGTWDKGTVYVDGVKYGYVEGYSAAADVLFATDIADGDLPGFTATYTFYLDAYGQIFAFAAKTAEDTNVYELVYISGTTETETGADVFGNKSYAYSVQYYKLDGSVNLASYVAKDGKTVAHAAGTDTSKVTYSALSGWALIANVDGGVAVKSLNGSTFTNGYKVESYEATDLELKATSTTMNSDFINSASTFLYTADSGFKSTNKAATVKTGAHASEITATMSVVVKESANVGKEDVVAVWVGKAFAGTTVTDVEFVYVVSYNGQVGYAADGTTALYQYTVLDKNGVESTATYKTNNSSASGFYKLVTDTATGLVALGDAYTTTISEDLKGADVYTVDGVKYAKKTAEYVVTNVKVIDLRAAVAAGTAEQVTTVEEAVALSSGSVTAIYTVDELTAVKTIGTIIVK